MTPVVELAWIAAGSNVGDRAAELAAARGAIARVRGTRIVAVSTVEETAAVGPVAQGPFLNQMLVVETALEPQALLDELQRIEQVRGRVRTVRRGPRTLDLDIVRFGVRMIDDARLTVPHPEIANRDFWQREMAELEGLLPATSTETAGR